MEDQKEYICAQYTPITRMLCVVSQVNSMLIALINAMQLINILPVNQSTIELCKYNVPLGVRIVSILKLVGCLSHIS